MQPGWNHDHATRLVVIAGFGLGYRIRIWVQLLTPDRGLIFACRLGFGFGLRRFGFVDGRGNEAPGILGIFGHAGQKDLTKRFVEHGRAACVRLRFGVWLGVADLGFQFGAILRIGLRLGLGV